MLMTKLTGSQVSDHCPLEYFYYVMRIWPVDEVDMFFEKTCRNLSQQLSLWSNQCSIRKLHELVCFCS